MTPYLTILILGTLSCALK